MYIAISGVGGIGKTTTLDWLMEYFDNSIPVIKLPDFMEPADFNLPIEEIVTFLAHQKLKRNKIITDYVNNKVLIFTDRTCLDPLALAMTLLSEEKWRKLEKWYNNQNFIYGHHILLKAPSSIIRDRRIERGSSPRTTLLKTISMSQCQFEENSNKFWCYIHKIRNIPFYEVDYSSQNIQTNRERLMNIISPLVDKYVNSFNT